jgi:methylase of polypeptide subunit release factors
MVMICVFIFTFRFPRLSVSSLARLPTPTSLPTRVSIGYRDVMSQSQGRPKVAKRKPIGYKLGKDARRRLSTWVEKSGITQKELAASAQCSFSCLKSILNGVDRDRRFKRSILEKLCQAVGTSLHEIELSPSKVQRATLFDFIELASLFAEIDASIMPIIRDTNADSAVLSTAYQDLFEFRADRRGLDLKPLCDRLNTAGFWSNCFFNLPRPGLRIQVADNLDSISYVIDSETLTVQKPILMRNCLCADMERPDPECAIHSKPYGSEILTRFDSGIVRLEFMQTDTFFRLEKSLWPPSMDSLIMASRLRQIGVFEKHFPRVLDLGSGTGFLGMIAMKQNRGTKLIHLSDWMLSPLLWGSFNCFQNRKNREHVEVRAILGRFGENLPSDRPPYDLCLCNPPYLPEFRSSPELNMRSAVYGTELLRYVILNHRQLAHKTYMQFSNIALDDAQTACKEAGARLVAVSDPTRLPFRPSYRQLNEDYLRFLKDRGLIVDQSKTYHYWHEIQLYTVTDR